MRYSWISGKVAIAVSKRLRTAIPMLKCKSGGNNYVSTRFSMLEAKSSQLSQVINLPEFFENNEVSARVSTLEAKVPNLKSLICLQSFTAAGTLDR